MSLSVLARMTCLRTYHPLSAPNLSANTARLAGKTAAAKRLTWNHGVLIPVSSARRCCSTRYTDGRTFIAHILSEHDFMEGFEVEFRLLSSFRTPES